MVNVDPLNRPYTFSILTILFIPIWFGHLMLYTVIISISVIKTLFSQNKFDYETENVEMPYSYMDSRIENLITSRQIKNWELVSNEYIQEEPKFASLIFKKKWSFRKYCSHHFWGIMNLIDKYLILKCLQYIPHFLVYTSPLSYYFRYDILDFLHKFSWWDLGFILPSSLFGFFITRLVMRIIKFFDKKYNSESFDNYFNDKTQLHWTIVFFISLGFLILFILIQTFQN